MGFGEKALQVLSLRCLGALLVDWEEEKGGFFPKSAGARGGVEGKNITRPVKWHIHLSHEQGTGGGGKQEHLVRNVLRQKIKSLL